MDELLFLIHPDNDDPAVNHLVFRSYLIKVYPLGQIVAVSYCSGFPNRYIPFENPVDQLSVQGKKIDGNPGTNLGCQLEFKIRPVQRVRVDPDIKAWCNGW